MYLVQRSSASLLLTLSMERASCRPTMSTRRWHCTSASLASSSSTVETGRIFVATSSETGTRRTCHVDVSHLSFTQSISYVRQSFIADLHSDLTQLFTLCFRFSRFFLQCGPQTVENLITFKIKKTAQLSNTTFNSVGKKVFICQYIDCPIDLNPNFNKCLTLNPFDVSRTAPLGMQAPLGRGHPWLKPL